MGLSNDLISQFVKATKDDKKTATESTVYGTIKVADDGSKSIVLDGDKHEQNPIPLSNEQLAVTVTNGDRVRATIKNHNLVVTGNIYDPSASSKDVSDANARIDDFDAVVADKVSTDELYAERARIDALVAEDIVIKDRLSANEADIVTLEADNVTINNTLKANTADISNLKVDKLDANTAKITYATIEDLDAAEADIYNLRSTYGEFVNLTTENFVAVNASIDDLYASKADVADANIIKANIADLNAEVANLDTLIFGSATGDTIQTSFSNSVIAQLGDAQIKSAMIESVSAGKITSGDIITNNVRVKSADGSLLISDETMQISDSTRVRVQIGKDAAGDYSINIWDQNGNLMFSKGGITDSAIKDAIIRNDMVSDTANIAAHKLDIDSLFEEINGSSNTIKSTQVYIDDKKQTLNVAFKAITEDVDDLESAVSSQGTQITAIQGQISSKIWQQDINTAKGELEKETETLSTKYSTLNQELDSVSAAVASNTTAISKKADSSTVTTVNEKVTSLEANLSGFKTTVSDTYATKNQVNGLDIGGRNWLLKTAAPVTVTGDGTENQCVYLYHFIDEVAELAGKKISISFEYTVSDYESGYFRLQTANKTWIGVTATITPAEDGTYIKQGSTTLSSATGYTFIQVRMDNFVGSITFSKMKVELGDKCTDWTPAPEDMASAADVANLTNRVSTAETSITQNATEIQSRATKAEVTEAVNNIAIGGRNLIRDSKMDADTDMWHMDYNHHTISYDNGYLEVSRVYDASYTNRTFNCQYSYTNLLLIPDELSGKTYVLQAELKAIDGISPSRNSSIFWRVYYDDGADFEEITIIVPEDLSTTEWRRCYATHTFGNKNWTNSQFTIALANSDNGMCVRNVMLERATKPSTWTPAPEDIETRVSSAETNIIQNADSISAVATRTTSNEKAIASLELTADGLTARVGTNESNISAAQSTANAAKSAAATAQSTADAAKKQLYHSASGTSGTTGYVGICQLKVTNNYQNRPILFELSNRGQQSSNVSLCFNNSNTTDPGIYHFQRDGGINVWAYKASTSTWQLIVQKSEGYDTIYVKDFSNTNGSVTVTWTNVHYSSLPEADITAATLLAGKIAKSVVDDAAKTATNYLNFSSSGLVVGDMTANTLGKNVRITSSTVDIREGSTTLASFGPSTIYLGKNSETAVINLCNGSATMRSVDDSDFKIYTDKRLVMSAYSSALLDCWRDSTHMTRISMQSADPDATYMWGGIFHTIYQGAIENTFDMSGNTTEFKITDGTSEAIVDLDETRLRVQANNTQINCTNGLYVGYDGSYAAKITLGYKYLQDKSIRWYWSDNALHDAFSNSNGQITYVGPGDIDETTTTMVRGQYVRLYAHNGGAVYLGYSGSTAVTSDRNMKTDILDIDDKYLDFFDRLRPITYKYDCPGNKGHRDHVGFVAQEVEEALIASGLTTEEFAGIIIEKDVTLNPNYDSSMTDEEKQAGETHYDSLYSLRYEEFISLLVKKVQSLQEQINQLRAV